MRDEAKILINGKRWKIRLVPPKELPSDADGTCSYPPGRFPSLEVNKNLSEKMIMVTLIHELLHASCEVLAEESVRLWQRDCGRCDIDGLARSHERRVEFSVRHTARCNVFADACLAS